MAFSLPNDWVWDHWIVRWNDQYHLFYLHAPRALGDPNRRHGRASIGHAVSDDAIEWEILPDAVVREDAPAFDDRSTWTGSTITHPKDGRMRMFYTGTSFAEDGLVQRIGWADSWDGVTFHRMEGPALEADPRWYETEEDRTWPDVAWRDPYVFFHDGQWHMLITARSNQGEPFYRGVVGHAVSDDLDNWEIQPPLATDTGFGQLEVIQQHQVGEKNIVVFSTDLEHADPDRYPGRATAGWLVEGEGPLGPWDFSTARPAKGDHLYAAQIFESADGEHMYTGFRNYEDDEFVGELPDPVPLDRVR